METAIALPQLWEFDKTVSQGRMVIAGVDEAGRGPLAGNVVAACVILDLSSKPISGLNDSKKLTENKRNALFLEIKSRALDFGIGECTPEEIDRYNILAASLLAMKRALECLRTPPDLVLVDGNREIPALGYPQTTLIKGDGLSASIAAASILAKVTRDRQMELYEDAFPGYGFARHKGYPTRDHFNAIKALGLAPIHRRSFRTEKSDQLDLFSA